MLTDVLMKAGEWIFQLKFCLIVRKCMIKENWNHSFFTGLTVFSWILYILFSFHLIFFQFSDCYLLLHLIQVVQYLYVSCECSVLLGVTKQRCFMFLFHFGRLIVAVKSIKRQHLVEVRSMANPPVLVKLALESICLLLGENASDWKSIRAVIMRDNFINTIVSNFSTEDIK